MAWLDTIPQFALGLCLHEDWESQGFYLYELNPDLQPSYSNQIIEAVEKVCPIDRSPEIEGRKAEGGSDRGYSCGRNNNLAAVG